LGKEGVKATFLPIFGGIKPNWNHQKGVNVYQGRRILLFKTNWRKVWEIITSSQELRNWQEGKQKISWDLLIF